MLLHSICQQIWKTQQWPQDWKRSVFISIPKKGNCKECSNYHTILFISCTSKVMLKIFQARLQQYVNWELPDVQAGFRRGRGTRDQIGNICWIIEKARKFQKNGCESWTIKKAECQRVDAFESWCWRRLFRDPCTIRRSNQSIPKEINPEYSLEGLMLKLKL